MGSCYMTMDGALCCMGLNSQLEGLLLTRLHVFFFFSVVVYDTCLHLSSVSSSTAVGLPFPFIFLLLVASVMESYQQSPLSIVAFPLSGLLFCHGCV